MSFNFDRRTFLKGAGAVGAASLLAACGEKSNNTGNGAAASGAAAPNSTGATPLKEFISFESGNRELESWNMLYTQKAEDANVVTNLWDGLLSFDRYGKVVPAIASSWEHNEDATVWTFHLRDDVDWVDCNGEVKAHLTSKDFLVGFEWVMNAIKNEANNTSMPNDTIVGAYEYYALTKEAGDAAADMTYEDMLAAGVGIEAPDDYTLVFTCPSACPYFDTVAAYNSFYPVAPALIEELGVDGFRSCDNTTMWYNGPYVVEEYIQGNTKSYIPNPNYYDAANVSRFERFTVTMISDGSISLQLYQSRELDEVDLGESNITTIQSDPSNEYNQQLCEKRAKKFSYCFIFNYDKKNTDGTPDENWNKAIANKAFRQCFSKGMVLNKFFARYNPINPLKCENDFFTMKGLCYTSDGTDYTNLVAKEMGLDGEAYDGKTMKRLRANNGDITELKKQAMEELSAIGVTFPVLPDFHSILPVPVVSSQHLAISQIHHAVTHYCPEKHRLDIFRITVIHVKQHDAKIFFFYYIIGGMNFFFLAESKMRREFSTTEVWHIIKFSFTQPSHDNVLKFSGIIRSVGFLCHFKMSFDGVAYIAEQL